MRSNIKENQNGRSINGKIDENINSNSSIICAASATNMAMVFNVCGHIVKEKNTCSNVRCNVTTAL